MLSASSGSNLDLSSSDTSPLKRSPRSNSSQSETFLSAGALPAAPRNISRSSHGPELNKLVLFTRQSGGFLCLRTDRLCHRRHWALQKKRAASVAEVFGHSQISKTFKEIWKGSIFSNIKWELIALIYTYFLKVSKSLSMLFSQLMGIKLT